MSSSYHYLFKFIIIGDTAVGKSCILYQFLDHKFREKHEMTVGVEFGAKVIEVQGKAIKLQIWDTAGQETFKSITRQYYRSAAGAILVYDITRKDSFENVKEWIRECRTHGAPDMVIILVGNKLDLEKERKVSRADGEAVAKEHGLFYLEASAKKDTNIREIFQKAGEQVFKQVQLKKGEPKDSIPGVRVGFGSETSGQSQGAQGGRCC